MLIVVIALVVFGLDISPASASAPRRQTFKLTVASGAWADAQRAIGHSQMQVTYGTTPGLIYGALCEDGGTWVAPIPKKIISGPNGVVLRLTLSAPQVAKADKALRQEHCSSELGIRTVEQDYRFASRTSSIQGTIETTEQALGLTTTTTTAPPPTTTTTSPSQYEASCSNSPAYGALTSPNAQEGLCVTYEAQVFQYNSDTGTTEMLVDVTNDGYGLWTDIVELRLPQSVVSQNFIQDDVIRFWGTTAGSDTYQTSIGGTNTVPVVDVTYATLVSAASS
jgi:hypothetical protein